jgi:hypothetical protein
MKIRPVEAELFHAEGQTKRHDEANSQFSQILRKRLKLIKLSWSTFQKNVARDVIQLTSQK